MTVGKRIAERRKLLKVSQEELADRIGTNQRQISRYERDENNPTGDVLVKIADTLDTTTDWILGRTEIADRLMRGQGDLTDDEVEILRLIRRNPEKRKAIYNVIKEIAQV
jgi:transcriptional regulator with XRE-family HTH domain